MTFISTLLKAAAALFMLVILMLLVQLDLTVFQTVEVLAPGWGWLAFVALLALEAGAVLWLGLAWFARAPRLVLRDDPSEAERQAFARELARRLKKNPHVRAAGIRATDEDFLEKALDVLDARAGEEIRNNAKRVFLGTALSQNGRLDALIMFVSLARMIWRVSGIYNQRPSPAELWSVYSTVSSATFISFSIEALDIPRTITESMNELLPAVTPVMAASSVPLMGPMMQQCTSAVIDGAANCLLAIRAGVVTRSAFRFAALGREEARQQACCREAGTMLTEISRETVGAIVEAFRKQLMDLPASMGQKISETVGTVADSALEKTRGAAQSVARGGTAVAEAVSSGAGAVIGAGQAVAGAVSSGTGAVADALGSGTKAVLGAVRGILPGNRRREATADERFVLHLALVWSQGRPGWKRRRQLARLCDAEGVSAGLRTLVDRHPDLDLLEPQLSFWRGRAEDVLACHRSLELEHGAAAAAWLAELDHRLGLGGSLQGGHEAPASGWKRFWK
ncbi:MAG TPA: DUF697 domain-containing protein [Desulfovibrio piger]|uniref:DUF697 domain-containing protein n=1 Tax=Desulfovibrio piger ATCC 29098 TaxID=411464 RepID=B6WY48_9BACT|nr:DUF697 domain-containing protein [Desulfovibrio piger]EEB32104.1 hypothetical protein DESPIG_03024 [Desulfovibrio piger ATCC 29098]HCZ44179.1 DUF697 domain-containing protein [Desulfovibrio piger]